MQVGLLGWLNKHDCRQGIIDRITVAFLNGSELLTTHNQKLRSWQSLGTSFTQCQTDYQHMHRAWRRDGLPVDPSISRLIKYLQCKDAVDLLSGGCVHLYIHHVTLVLTA